jgi:microcystin degradation protein MlrC
MGRIAVGGIQHETNTFSPVKATYDDFVAPDAWPGLTRGGALFDAIAGVNRRPPARSPSSAVCVTSACHCCGARRSRPGA